MPMDDVLAWPFSGSSRSAQFVGRAFGSAEPDLDVDFIGQTRPAIVTELIVLCIKEPGGGEILPNVAWGWTTARRTQAVLTIAVRTSGDKLELGVTCPIQDCHEILELSLRLTDFEQKEDPSSIECKVGNGPMFGLRLPTGADQHHWWHQGLLKDRDRVVMATDLVTIVDGFPPQADWRVDCNCLEQIDQALQERDPLTDLSIETSCPYCEATFSVDVDLEKELLKLLERRQPRLLDDIHHIAAAYHWTEEQILDLNPVRRDQYLARICGEEF